MTHSIRIASLICLLAGSGTALAEDKKDEAVDATTKWDKLGERMVTGAVDHDAIRVGRTDGRFRKIMLKVEHSALELFDVVIKFGDGSKYAPATRLVFDKDTTSRVIELPGGARFLRFVEFRYANLPGGGRAQIELWAR